MNKILCAALIFALSVSLAHNPSASATVLTFDDISANPNPNPVPDGYGGLNWSNIFYSSWTSSPDLIGTGYQHGAVSGTFTAFNAFGNPAAVSDSLFTFNGAYLTGAWNDGLNITVNGLLNGSPIYSQTVVVNTTAPTFFNFNYVGINEVDFNSFGGTPHPGLHGSGTHFAMDNFTINAPEPSSMTLLVIGAIGSLVVVGRRRGKGGRLPRPKRR